MLLFSAFRGGAATRAIADGRDIVRSTRFEEIGPMRSPTLAQVISVAGQDAAARMVDGTEVRVGTTVHPEVGPGDWVIIGVGTVLRVMDRDEGERLAAEFRQSAGGEATADPE